MPLHGGRLKGSVLGLSCAWTQLGLACAPRGSDHPRGPLADHRAVGVIAALQVVWPLVHDDVRPGDEVDHGLDVERGLDPVSRAGIGWRRAAIHRGVGDRGADPVATLVCGDIRGEAALELGYPHRLTRSLVTGAVEARESVWG